MGRQVWRKGSVIFNILNHASLGQPDNGVGTTNFGRITSARFPTGESGLSRQVQFALKMMFSCDRESY